MGRLLILLLTLLALIFTSTVVESFDDDKLSWPPVKNTKLHFFVHVKMSPPNATQVVVVKPSINDLPFNFGEVIVYDEPLTIHPNSSSPKLGNCQDMYIMLDQNKRAALSSMSLAFSHGKYTGCTLVLIGYYNFELTGGDFPIFGGTRYFNHAQGVCWFEFFSDDPEIVFVIDCDVYHRPLHTTILKNNQLPISYPK